MRPHDNITRDLKYTHNVSEMNERQESAVGIDVKKWVASD